MFTIKRTLLPTLLLALSLGMTASAQVYNSATTPSLAVQLLTTGLTPNPGPGTTNNTMAVVRLDTTYSSDGIRISNLPIIVTTGNGATAASLQSCQVYNEASPTVALNTSGNISSSLASGLNVINLDTPLIIPRGTVVTLDVRCNMASTAVTGGTFQFSINTANVSATGSTTGLPAAVYVGVSTPGGVPVTPTPIPGYPNTGAGGNAPMNIALLLGSLVAASLGVLYARRAVR